MEPEEYWAKVKPFLATNEEEQKLPDVIYHYCPIESLFGIMKTHTLWLTHQSAMNDPLESRLFYRVLCDEASRQMTSENEKQLRAFLDNYRLNLKDYFLACFSTQQDSLSQWAMYANNGCGVAIGFYPEQLCTRFQVPTLGNSPIGIFRVRYDERSTTDLARDLIELSQEIYGGSPPSVERHSLTIKHEGFANENEIRLAEVQALDTNINPDEQNLRSRNPAAKLKFRTRGTSEIIPFREHTLATDGEKLRIDSIVLGPNCELNPRSLQLFLEHNDVVLEPDRLLQSEIPYQ